jgi:Predicted membrane protein (DUF2142)
MARRTVARVRSTPLVLAILLAVAAVHGTAWAVMTAPWQGPDEVAHFAYAEHLAETGHAPQRNQGTGSQSTAHNVALFSVNLFPIRLQVGGRPTPSALPRTKAGLAALPASARKNGSGPNSAANYPPLYYAYEAVGYKVSPWRSEFGRLFTMRLFTVALFVLTVGLTWLIAAELLAVAWARALATALVALQPKLAFGGGIVNPDLMLVVLATGALLAALRLVKRGPTTGASVVLAACSAGAILTHPRGYFLAPFAVIALAIAALRFRERRRTAVVTGVLVAGVSVVAILLATLWVRGHTGGPGASGTGNPPIVISPREFLSYLWQFYLPKLSFMNTKVGPSFYGYRQVYIESFFGNFASLSVNYRPVFYDVLQLLAAVGLAALYTTIVVRWRAVLAQWPVVVVAVTFFLGLMALLHVVSYSSLRGGGTDPVITGRYLLPAIALYGVAAAWVCSSLPRRAGLVAAGVLLGVAALMAVGGVGLSMERFYV